MDAGSKRSSRIRIVLLIAAAVAAVVVTWRAPGSLVSWTLLTILFGLSIGVIRWLHWDRHAAEDPPESDVDVRRRRLARLTGRGDLFRSTSGKEE